MSSAGNRLKKLADKHPGLGLNLDCDAQPASAGVSSVDALSLSQQPEKCVQFKTLHQHFSCIDAKASSSRTVCRDNVMRCSLTARRQSRPPPSPVQHGARYRRCPFPFITERQPGLPAHSP